MAWKNKTDTSIYYFSDLIKETKMLTPTKRNEKFYHRFMTFWV